MIRFLFFLLLASISTALFVGTSYEVDGTRYVFQDTYSITLNKAYEIPQSSSISRICEVPTKQLEEDFQNGRGVFEVDTTKRNLGFSCGSTCYCSNFGGLAGACGACLGKQYQIPDRSCLSNLASKVSEALNKQAESLTKYTKDSIEKTVKVIDANIKKNVDSLRVETSNLVSNLQDATNVEFSKVRSSIETLSNTIGDILVQVQSGTNTKIADLANNIDQLDSLYEARQRTTIRSLASLYKSILTIASSVLGVTTALQDASRIKSEGIDISRILEVYSSSNTENAFVANFTKKYVREASVYGEYSGATRVEYYGANGIYNGDELYRCTSFKEDPACPPPSHVGWYARPGSSSSYTSIHTSSVSLNGWAYFAGGPTPYYCENGIPHGPPSSTCYPWDGTTTSRFRTVEDKAFYVSTKPGTLNDISPKGAICEPYLKLGEKEGADERIPVYLSYIATPIPSRNNIVVDHPLHGLIAVERCTKVARDNNVNHGYFRYGSSIIPEFDSGRRPEPYPMPVYGLSPSITNLRLVAEEGQYEREHLYVVDEPWIIDESGLPTATGNSATSISIGARFLGPREYFCTRKDKDSPIVKSTNPSGNIVPCGVETLELPALGTSIVTNVLSPSGYYPANCLIWNDVQGRIPVYTIDVGEVGKVVPTFLAGLVGKRIAFYNNEEVVVDEMDRLNGIGNSGYDCIHYEMDLLLHSPSNCLPYTLPTYTPEAYFGEYVTTSGLSSLRSLMGYTITSIEENKVVLEAKLRKGVDYEAAIKRDRGSCPAIEVTFSNKCTVTWSGLDTSLTYKVGGTVVYSPNGGATFPSIDVANAGIVDIKVIKEGKEVICNRFQCLASTNTFVSRPVEEFSINVGEISPLDTRVDGTISLVNITRLSDAWTKTLSALQESLSNLTLGTNVNTTIDLKLVDIDAKTLLKELEEDRKKVVEELKANFTLEDSNEATGAYGRASVGLGFGLTGSILSVIAIAMSGIALFLVLTK